MVARKLSAVEVEEYRSTYRAQLRDALVLGRATAPIRKALAELDATEAAMREEAEREVDARTNAVMEHARQVAAEVDAKIAAVVATLAPPAALP